MKGTNPENTQVFRIRVQHTKQSKSVWTPAGRTRRCDDCTLSQRRPRLTIISCAQTVSTAMKNSIPNIRVAEHPQPQSHFITNPPHHQAAQRPEPAICQQRAEITDSPPPRRLPPPMHSQCIPPTCSESPSFQLPVQGGMERA